LNLELPWDEQPIVVIDFETTGPDPETCMPVEVGAVRFEYGEPVADFASLLNPLECIPPEATKIHGITDAMVASAPTLFDVAPTLLRICAGAQPCAFNEPFDRRILHREIAGSDCYAFDPGWQWLDVYVMVASPRIDKYKPGAGRLKLGACALRWGVALSGAHRALGDCMATGGLLFKLRDRGKVKSCPLGRILAHTREMRRLQDEDHARFAARCAAERASQHG
jgi:DNA polymerase-3 subunit epsilon